jgi:hypothetical protein
MEQSALTVVGTAVAPRIKSRHLTIVRTVSTVTFSFTGSLLG